MSGLNSTMEDIGVNIQQLLFTDPFFCYFLSGIDRLILFKEDEDDPDLKGKFVPITGVGKSNNLSYALYVNADGWDKLKEVQRATGIQGLTHDQLRHEGLHISYTHPSIQGNYKHPDIFAVAADLEINQFMSKAFHEINEIMVDLCKQLEEKYGCFQIMAEMIDSRNYYYQFYKNGRTINIIRNSKTC